WTKGTTEAINLIANGLATLFKEGDEIIVSEMEHHANIVPWQLMAQKTGAVIRVLEVNEAGELSHQQLLELLNPRTKVLAMMHVSNVLGTINPVKQFIATAKAAGLITVIDGAQAVPHFQVDVR